LLGVSSSSKEIKESDGHMAMWFGGVIIHAPHPHAGAINKLVHSHAGAHALGAR
jgi:hypothetical protein